VVAIENILLAAVSVFSLALTLIAVLAFRRTRDQHLIFLAAAFGVFFLKGLLLTIFLFA
jgi:predicted membrane protein